LQLQLQLRGGHLGLGGALLKATQPLHNEMGVICLNSNSRGRCYDHKFHRFFPIFGEKNGVFLKYQGYDHFLKLALF
jgi:hypothetical protein